MGKKLRKERERNLENNLIYNSIKNKILGNKFN